MLPEGHIPGDKTLHLLARLSEEIDKTEASHLLVEEINRRCQDVDLESPSRILTSADVLNVLNLLVASSSHDAKTPPESSQPTETPSANISIKHVQSSSQKLTRSSARGSPAEPPKATPDTPRSSPNPNAAAAVQGYFTTALQAWLDLSNIDPELATESPMTKTILEPSTGKDQRLRALVMERSKAAGIMSKAYTTSAEVKTLKRYLAGLTLELSSSFPLPDITTCDEVVEVFKAIHAIFLHESKAPAPERHDIDHLSKDPIDIILSSQTIIPSTQPSKPTIKRKRNEDLSNQKVKRQKPKTGQPLPWQDIDISKLFDKPSRSQRSNSVDHADATILIDRSSPAIKTDEDQEDKDLYYATPPLQPAERKRPPRSSAYF